MFNKLRNLKFEKINMKFVVAIGLAVILILTLIFIYFRTNLFVDRSKKNSNSNSNSTSNSSSNSNNDSNSNSNSNSNPNYEDPDDKNDDLTVSDEAKNRTKSPSKLNQKEIEYLLQENFESIAEDSAKECNEKGYCNINVVDLLTYTHDPKVGITIANCNGNMYFVYDEKTKKFDYDMTKVKCTIIKN